MRASYDIWPYWTVDLPGLSRTKAHELLAMAEQAGMSFGGTIVDPAQFLTLHLDRQTVESLYRALSVSQPHQKCSIRIDPAIVNGIRDVLKEWLDGVSGE